jgi:hypothetical protein
MSVFQEEVDELAVQMRHAAVEQHHIKVRMVDLLQGGQPIVGSLDLIPA